MYVFIQSSCFFLFFLFSFFYVFTHLAVFQPFLSPFPPYLSLFPCYLCLAEITAARDCRKGLCCKPEYSLAVSSSPLWGARRAQLAAQNSPFSWRVKGSEKNTHTHTPIQTISSQQLLLPCILVKLSPTHQNISGCNAEKVSVLCLILNLCLLRLW